MSIARIGIITVSDRVNEGIYEDLSGKAIINTLNDYLTSEWKEFYKIVPDEQELIEKAIIDLVDNKQCCLVITTGGTGLTGRDITPEAIEEIADKQIPGFGEVFRTISLKTVGTSAIQSRACAVLANGKYVFALPGSSGGVTDAWDGILKHQLDINHKPCNFVELFPRLKEK